MIRALTLWFLCRYKQWHDVGTARAGTCQRCHLPIGENGCAL